MLDYLKEEASLTTTENGALTYSTSSSECLDLFFRAGAMRQTHENVIRCAVLDAYAEDPEKTMKILFFARDVRGGLGERRFFRIAADTLAAYEPEAIERNIPFIPEYGRFDDLCIFLGTACEATAVEEIKKQLEKDIVAMNENKQVSLLAKWLPSANASSKETILAAKHLMKKLGMNEKTYRQTLSALRKYSDILENRLRENDYTFDYSIQPSRAMFKYRRAFIRNDEKRYCDFLNSVEEGKTKINTAALYPYDIVRRCLNHGISEQERKALNVTWENLPNFGDNDENAIAVIDGSGSMTCGIGTVRPIDAALSLGIYFAEHNKGVFANHFITFSASPKLVKIKGKTIYEKVGYCAQFSEAANTNLEAVFLLILNTAVKNNLPQNQLPSKIFIISDMEFDYCIIGGNNDTLFETMKQEYAKYGYKLPDIVFWNVNSRQSNMPVRMSDTGAALVSGYSPAIFDMVISQDVSPVNIMNKIIGSERYAPIK